MGKISVEQQNGRTYLVCKVESGEVIDEDCLTVVSDEQTSDGKQGIQGIIPIIYSQKFEDRYLRYDINTYTPLAEYKKQITTARQAGTLFLSILETYSQVEAYLLEPAYFLLEEEYIFVQESTGKAQFILYPVYSRQGEVDFRKLFGQIMMGIRLRDEDMDFYGKIIFELNNTDSFNIVKCREMLLNAMEGKQTPHAVSETKAAHSNGKPSYAAAPEGHRGAENSMGTVQKRPVSGKPAQEDMPPVIGGGKKKEEHKDWASFFGLDKDGNSQKKTDKKADKKAEKPEKKQPGKKQSEKKQPEKKQGGLFAKKEKKPKVHSMIQLPDEEDIPIGFGMGKAVPAPREEKAVPEKDVIPMTVDDDDLPVIGQTEDEPWETPVVSYLNLIHCDTGREIPVRRFPFVIGREGDGFRVDAAKDKVSRRHAVIIQREDSFLICDESKHGTFADEVKLPKGEYVPLENGMHLRLKEEEFDVKIYEA